MPDWFFDPLWKGPSRLAKKTADTIDNPQGEGGYLRGFGAGALEGAGDLASDMTSPFSIGMQALGAGGLGKLAKLLGRGAKAAPEIANTANKATPFMDDITAEMGPEFVTPGREGWFNHFRRIAEAEKPPINISGGGAPMPQTPIGPTPAMLESKLASVARPGRFDKIQEARRKTQKPNQFRDNLAREY